MLWLRHFVVCWLASCALSGVGYGIAGSSYDGMVVEALDWSDLTLGAYSSSSTDPVVETLSIEQVMEMRVRDIKWRLARQHGYSADELGRMIDKKELIQALAFEEEKIRLKVVEQLQRTVMKRGLFWTLLAIVVVILWPVLKQGIDALSVNFVVYTDRKSFEARRCWELKSPMALFGVAIMFGLELLQLWLYMSVLLSWFISRNKYFFPIPNIPIRPADFIGGEAQKTFGGYGINVGSMAVTWGLRFLHGRVEAWTGRVMLKAQKELRKESKRQQARNKTETATKDQVSQAARQDGYNSPEQDFTSHDASTGTLSKPPSSLPRQWMEPIIFQEEELFPTDEQVVPNTTAFPPPQQGSGRVNPSPGVPVSSAHLDFLEQLNKNTENEESDWDDVMGELD
ncbi:hypothetical protein ACA910_014616 [Epithemia clementina (nom. ined.)]